MSKITEKDPLITLQGIDLALVIDMSLVPPDGRHITADNFFLYNDSRVKILTNTTFNTNGSGNALTIGKELDLGPNSIGGTVQSATGDGATTIDWGAGNFFNFQFGAFNETFTFTDPAKPGTFLLKLVQDSVGSRTVTWPVNVKWPGGAAPTLTTTLTTGTDIITFYYDGTDYFAVDVLDFS